MTSPQLPYRLKARPASLATRLSWYEIPRLVSSVVLLWVMLGPLLGVLWLRFNFTAHLEVPLIVAGVLSAVMVAAWVGLQTRPGVFCNVQLTGEGLALRRASFRTFFPYSSIRRIQLTSVSLRDDSPSSPLIPLLTITTPDPERPQDIAYYEHKAIELHMYPDEEVRKLLQVLVEKCPAIYFNNQSLDFLNDDRSPKNAVARD